MLQRDLLRPGDFFQAPESPGRRIVGKRVGRKEPGLGDFEIRDLRLVRLPPVPADEERDVVAP